MSSRRASFEPTAAERERLTEAATSSDIRQIATVTLDAAARSIGQQAVYDMDIADIPEDSKLAQSARAREEARMTAEAVAADLESKPKREPAPSTSGRPPGTNTQHDTNTFIGVTRAVRDGQMTTADGEKRLAEIKAGVTR